MSEPGNIRLLLSDVDGTLVTKDKVLTEAARAAAHDLRKAGIALALTSSRPAKGLSMLVQPLGLTEPVAGFNGGVLANPDMSVIETHPIDPQSARQTVDLLTDQGVDVWVYTEDKWYVPAADAPHVAREAWILKFDPILASGFTSEHLARAIKIVGVSDDHARLAAAEKAAQDMLGEDASATRSAAYFLDVTNSHANKGAVVHTLSQRLGIPTSQIATIGDMQNDVLMFRQSGFSIAMGNAEDEVKSQASAVTDSNEDDGFAHAVRRFILPTAAR